MLTKLIMCDRIIEPHGNKILLLKISAWIFPCRFCVKKYYCLETIVHLLSSKY